MKVVREVCAEGFLSRTFLDVLAYLLHAVHLDTLEQALALIGKVERLHRNDAALDP